jgi:hypothetical protein
VIIHFQYEARFDDNLKRILEKKRYAGRHEGIALPIRELLAEEGRTVDFSSTVSFTAPVEHLEAPAVRRTIAHVGLAIKPKSQTRLDGPAEVDVSYDGAPPVHAVTNEVGVLATADAHPAGTGLAELEAMTHGKGVDRPWSITVTALPGGLTADEIDDVILLVDAEYAE